MPRRGPAGSEQSDPRAPRTDARCRTPAPGERAAGVGGSGPRRAPESRETEGPPPPGSASTDGRADGRGPVVPWSPRDGGAASGQVRALGRGREAFVMRDRGAPGAWKAGPRGRCDPALLRGAVSVRLRAGSDAVGCARCGTSPTVTAGLRAAGLRGPAGRAHLALPAVDGRSGPCGRRGFWLRPRPGKLRG